jgi:hypothetical protein
MVTPLAAVGYGAVKSPEGMRFCGRNLKSEKRCGAREELRERAHGSGRQVGLIWIASVDVKAITHASRSSLGCKSCAKALFALSRGIN